MSRIYLDYNATSPYADKVLSFLSSGDVPFANPSSAHSSGKSARKHVNQVNSFLLSNFKLLKSHKIIHHSGATEFTNSLFTGLRDQCGFFYFPSDHPCVTEVLKNIGSDAFVLKINSSGDFDLNDVVSQINKFQDKSGKRALLNFTNVHNETGVVWPLELAKEIKLRTNCLIHVDAVQSIGKIENFLNLESEIDYYTYSAHKFGALKGVGFSFIRNEAPFEPYLIGGGQQSGYRAGTENVLGICSIKLALEEMIELFRYEESLKFKLEVENKILNILGNKGEIIGVNAKYGRNINTICFVLYNKKADISLIQFDLSGLDVSSGSACSVQSLKDSATLVAMNYKNYASNSIRISFGPNDYLSPNKFNKLFDVIKNLVK